MEVRRHGTVSRTAGRAQGPDHAMPATRAHPGRLASRTLTLGIVRLRPSMTHRRPQAHGCCDAPRIPPLDNQPRPRSPEKLLHEEPCTGYGSQSPGVPGPGAGPDSGGPDQISNRPQERSARMPTPR